MRSFLRKRGIEAKRCTRHARLSLARRDLLTWGEMKEKKRKEAAREMCDEDRAADWRRGGKMSRECSSDGKKSIHDDNFKTSYPSDFSIKISFLIKLHLPPTTMMMMIHRHDHDHFVSLLHLHLFINGWDRAEMALQKKNESVQGKMWADWIFSIILKHTATVAESFSFFQFQFKNF